MFWQRRRGSTPTGSIWIPVEGRQQTLCLYQDTSSTRTHTLAKKHTFFGRDQTT